MDTACMRLLHACTQGLGIRPKIYYQQTFKSDFRMQIHSHTLLEMMYAASNYFIVVFPDDNGHLHPVKVKQGEYIIINTAVYHSLKIQDRQAQIVNIEFQFNEDDPFSARFAPLYEQSAIFRQFIDTDWDYAVIGDNDQILSLMKRIQSVLMSRDAALEDHTDDIMLQLLTNQLFLESARAYVYNRDVRGSYYVQRATEYINEHFDEDIKIADIAAYININATYLENLFKQHTHLTLTNYINKQRVAKAVSYLSGTKMPVIEIGFIVGFNNRQHFSRVFKQLMHVSPGEYRRKINSAEYKNYQDLDQYVIDKYGLDHFAQPDRDSSRSAGASS